jgi:hypothetical protein
VRPSASRRGSPGNRWCVESCSHAGARRLGRVPGVLRRLGERDGVQEREVRESPHLHVHADVRRHARAGGDRPVERRDHLEAVGLDLDGVHPRRRGPRPPHRRPVAPQLGQPARRLFRSLPLEGREDVPVRQPHERVREAERAGRREAAEQARGARGAQVEAVRAPGAEVVREEQPVLGERVLRVVRAAAGRVGREHRADHPAARGRTAAQVDRGQEHPAPARAAGRVGHRVDGGRPDVQVVTRSRARGASGAPPAGTTASPPAHGSSQTSARARRSRRQGRSTEQRMGGLQTRDAAGSRSTPDDAAACRLRQAWMAVAGGAVSAPSPGTARRSPSRTPLRIRAARRGRPRRRSRANRRAWRDPARRSGRRCAWLGRDPSGVPRGEQRRRQKEPRGAARSVIAPRASQRP